jgi:LytS/YehU family sensor histidine kinase
MRTLAKKGLVGGGVVALVISILHSQAFRPDLFGWPELLAWYLVSLLVGCLAGFIAGSLISRIPARLNPAVAYLGGALLGIFAYYIQVILLLTYVFSTTSWE